MKVVAFTGAGISKQSGIDTFEEQTGLRDKLHRSYAKKYPEEYRQAIKQMKEHMRNAKPNEAHLSLAKNHVPIITMNIDGLHQRAGSKDVLELHGCMPLDEELEYADLLFNKPVLYGDPAPNYELAYHYVSQLQEGDIFLVIGCSYYTAIAGELREVARRNKVQIIEINEDAKYTVPKVLDKIFQDK